MRPSHNVARSILSPNAQNKLAISCFADSFRFRRQSRCASRTSKSKIQPTLLSLNRSTGQAWRILCRFQHIRAATNVVSKTNSASNQPSLFSARNVSPISRNRNWKFLHYISLTHKRAVYQFVFKQETKHPPLKCKLATPKRNRPGCDMVVAVYVAQNSLKTFFGNLRRFEQHFWPDYIVKIVQFVQILRFSVR